MKRLQLEMGKKCRRNGVVPRVHLFVAPAVEIEHGPGNSSLSAGQENGARITQPHVVDAHGYDLHVRAAQFAGRRFLTGLHQHADRLEAGDCLGKAPNVPSDRRKFFAPHRRARRPCHPAAPVQTKLARHRPS